MRSIPFVKYEQAGNDFILVDACKLTLPSDLAIWGRKVCNRNRGIGADGLLLLFPSILCDYSVKIFNADGSEPAMCGNGVSSVFSYLFSMDANRQECSLETLAGPIYAKKEGKEIAVSLGHVQVLHFPIQIPGLGTWYVVNTGVPHAVYFQEEGEERDVFVEGKRVRAHPLFAPYGVNVNFARVLDSEMISVRTYERGVENETLSCATGSAAAAFVAKKIYQIPGEIAVANRLDFSSAPILFEKKHEFRFDKEGNQIQMKVSASCVFAGVIEV